MPSLPSSIARLSQDVYETLLCGDVSPELIVTRARALTPSILAAQREHIPLVDRFLTTQNISGDAPWWKQAIPSDLFRAATLFAGPEEAISQRFASSGTTDPQRRSQAAFSETGLELMSRCVVTGARASLFPDEIPSLILVLAPPPELAPQMIMAWGMARLIEHFGLPGSCFLIDGGGLDPKAVAAALENACTLGCPVTLIGASFGFVHLLDFFVSQGLKFRLPRGSRTLDAGGFKGRSRAVSPSDLRESIGQTLGIPPDFAVNLLGMTELASQLYDDRLAASHRGEVSQDAKIGPPWTQTVVLDPGTLERCPPGETGLLCHLDLANVERPAAIRTSDLGRTVGDGFEILGRAEGAAAAGCSLSVEELLAQRSRR